jgi:hypothetical protein
LICDRYDSGHWVHWMELVETNRGWVLEAIDPACAESQNLVDSVDNWRCSTWNEVPNSAAPRYCSTWNVLEISHFVNVRPAAKNLL